MDADLRKRSFTTLSAGVRDTWGNRSFPVTGGREGSLIGPYVVHDWRASKITNDLEAKENPVEVSANARHHSPGYTMEKYGRRRSEAAKKPAASTAGRIGLSRVLSEANGFSVGQPETPDM